jgi:hypothetical protein
MYDDMERTRYLLIRIVVFPLKSRCRILYWIIGEHFFY